LGERPAATHSRPPHSDRSVQSWDTANKATELRDFSACTTWGVSGKHLFLLDVFRRRLEYPALKRAVREQQSLLDAQRSACASHPRVYRHHGALTELAIRVGP
jgi:phage terminase large subunit-like protein